MSISLLQPAYLKKGDTVAIVATATAISFEEIAFGVKMLEDWGLQVKIGNTIGKKQGLFAGTDEERTQDLQSALDDTTIQAIIFARGGYGTVRIIDKLDFRKFMSHPKWICGFSDITVLHTHINQVLAIQTMHSIMLSKFATASAEAIESFRKALFGEELKIIFDAHPLNQNGIINTSIYGGNLSILYSLTGTNSSFSFQHKSLFIEDIEEYLYHVDRMMMNMKRAGKLNSLDALLVGGFSDMKDSNPSFEKSSEEIILEYIQDKKIPIAFGVPCGHISDNRTLIFGKKCLLAISEKEVVIDFNN